MSRRARIRARIRDNMPPEIPALYAERGPFRVLIASALALFALAIFPPFLSPGAAAVQNTLKEDPGSLALITLLGIAIGAGTLLFGGALGDTNGHRRWLLVGLAGLVVASVLGIFAGDSDAFLIIGLLAAFWSGFALPLGIAVLADAYPDRLVQDMAIGLGLGALGAAQIIAPPIMDVLADLIGDWATFILPIVTGGLALVLVWRDVPEQVVPESLRRRDVMAQALAAAIPLTIASLVIVLIPGEVDGIVLVALAIIAAFWVLFGLLRRRRGRGILPEGAAPGRMILVALFVGVFMSFAVNAPLLYFGSFLQVINGWDDISAAIAMIPHLIPLLLGGLLAPVLTHRYGYANVVVLSMVVLVVAVAGFALADADTGYLWFVAPLFLLGGGMIFGATARAGLILLRMPKELPGLANALNLASMELGAILGQTVMTVALMRFATGFYQDALAEAGVDEAQLETAVGGFREAINSVSPGGTTIIPPDRVEGLLPGFQAALADGLSLSLWFVTGLTLIATILTHFLFRWARSGDEEEPSEPTDEPQVEPEGATT